MVWPQKKSSILERCREVIFGRIRCRNGFHRYTIRISSQTKGHELNEKTAAALLHSQHIWNPGRAPVFGKIITMSWFALCRCSGLCRNPIVFRNKAWIQHQLSFSGFFCASAGRIERGFDVCCPCSQDSGEYSQLFCSSEVHENLLYFWFPHTQDQFILYRSPSQI